MNLATFSNRGDLARIIHSSDIILKTGKKSNPGPEKHRETFVCLISSFLNVLE